MLGNNTIILNQATMIVALQFYFESIYKEGFAPQVSCVIATHKDASCFEVGLVETPKQVEK